MSKNYVLGFPRIGEQREHNKSLLMFSLISPSKTRNHNAWAVNQRTYEILVNTVTY